MHVPLQASIVGIVIVTSLVALSFSAVVGHSKDEVGSYGRVVNSNGERSAPSESIVQQTAIGMLLSYVPAFVGTMHTHYQIELKNHTAFANHTVLFMWEALTPVAKETPILAFGNKCILVTPTNLIFRVANQTVSVYKNQLRYFLRTSKIGHVHLLFINNSEVARIYEKNWSPHRIVTLNYVPTQPSGGHVMYNDMKFYGHN